MSTRILISRALLNLAGCWQSLVGTELIYKMLGLCVLFPIFSILLGYSLTFSGNQALTDIDIAAFFASPWGLPFAISLGSIWLGLLAIEQASLLAVLAAQSQQKKLRPLAALLFAVTHVIAILKLTGRILVISILIIAPFLAALWGIYFLLLGDHDINFYLQQWPPKFRIAIALGIALALIFVGILLRLVSGWFLALPLILFENVPARNALGESSRKIVGNRPRVFWRLAFWLLFVFVANLAATFAIGKIAAWLVPTSIGSLAVLAGRVGLMMAIWVIVSFAINVVATISFAVILFECYREFCPKWKRSIGTTRLEAESNATSQKLITKTRLLIAGFAGLLLVSLIGFWMLQSVQLTDHAQVLAHRGSSKVAPENSLAAFQQSILDRADWVEIDVQETADGQVVVVHDSDLMKLAKDPIKIWELTSDELQSIDIGSLFDPKYSGERVPTLREVLELCRDRIKVVIELKYYGRDQQLEQRVVDIVEQTGMAEQIMVMSLKAKGIKKLKGLRPNWKCGLLLSVSVGNVQKIEADFLAVNARFASRALVKKVHSAGKQIYVWTVDEPSMMSSLMNRGVDGILTNRPELARQVLESRAEMSISERLLTEIAAMLRADQGQVIEEH
jgi:glycerophosphoryl diester phosphodiesterase